MALLEDIDEWISPDANMEAFFELIWNIRRQGGAAGYGLDVWGRIVNVSRVVSMTTFGPSFGFNEAGDRTGFDQANFYVDDRTTTNFTMSDEIYRLLIFARAALNITDCSIPAINAILRSLFPGRGNAFVTDGANGPTPPLFGFAEAGDRTGFDQGTFDDSQIPSSPRPMSIIYNFEFDLEPFEIAIVTNSGVLPRPVGVGASALYGSSTAGFPPPSGGFILSESGSIILSEGGTPIQVE